VRRERITKDKSLIFRRTFEMSSKPAMIDCLKFAGVFFLNSSISHLVKITFRTISYSNRLSATDSYRESAMILRKGDNQNLHFYKT